MTDDLKKSAVTGQAALPTGKVGYNRFLLLVAGLGGLLYGVDVGIIAGALPISKPRSRMRRRARRSTPAS